MQKQGLDQCCHDSRLERGVKLSKVVNNMREQRRCVQAKTVRLRLDGRLDGRFIGCEVRGQ